MRFLPRKKTSCVPLRDLGGVIEFTVAVEGLDMDDQYILSQLEKVDEKKKKKKRNLGISYYG